MHVLPLDFRSGEELKDCLQKFVMVYSPNDEFCSGSLLSRLTFNGGVGGRKSLELSVLSSVEEEMTLRGTRQGA